MRRCTPLPLWSKGTERSALSAGWRRTCSRDQAGGKAYVLLIGVPTEQSQQQSNRFSAHLLQRLSQGRQRRNCVCRLRHVVEPHDRQVVGNPQPQLSCLSLIHISEP